MAKNLAGLGVIYDKPATQNQQFFQLKAVPGSLVLVAVDGVLQNEETFTLNKSVLVLDEALEEGQWVYVISGQGGTFIPQEYVDDAVEPKADKTYVDTQLDTKMNKSGGAFTGAITVQEPTQPMNPVTKQLFDTLPESATPEYIDAVVEGKADADEVEAALNAKIDEDQKGVPDGIAALDEDADIYPANLPEVVFNDDKSFSKFGPLAAGPGQGRWYPRYPGIFIGIIGFVELPPEGGPVRVNMIKHYTDTNGVEQSVSIFPGGDRLIIPADDDFTEYTFTTFPTFERGDSITAEIEAVGTVSTGQTLTLQVEYAYTP